MILYQYSKTTRIIKMIFIINSADIMSMLVEHIFGKRLGKILTNTNTFPLHRIQKYDICHNKQ